MNYHFRSFSEQHTTSNNNNNSIINQQPAVVQSDESGPQANSIIRIHTDSQQSLDRLFNPVQATIPFKDRQLPKSFFDPSYSINETTNGNSNNSNQFHARSLSYGQARPVVGRTGYTNLHMRTTSTLAPLPALTSSNQSSLQSSREALNQNSSIGNHCDSHDWLNSTTNGGIADHSSPANHLHYTQQVPNPTFHHQEAPGHPQQQIFYPNQVPTMVNDIPASNVADALNHTTGHHVHSRSMSFDQSQGIRMNPHHQNLHMRTHSTVMTAPNPTFIDQTSASYLSSHELLDNTNCTVSSMDGCSSSGYSTDDMTTTNCWVAAGQPVQHPVMANQHPQTHLPPQQQPQQQQQHQSDQPSLLQRLSRDH